jgi:hypothetical protein
VQGAWDAKKNRLYKRCFEVDIIAMTGSSGKLKPIVPKFESWVRIMSFEDVKVEDVAWKVIGE